MQAPNGCGRSLQRSPAGLRLVVDAIVGGFLGDDDVVHMAFTQARRRDLTEGGVLEQVVEGAGTHITHTGTQTAHELVDGFHHMATVRHAAHDAFGDQLLAAFLEVTVGAAVLHGVDGAHAAVDLVGTALVEDGFARAFFGTGEQGADHHGVGAHHEGLDDVTGELDAAVSDAAAVHLAGSAAAVHDGGHLRHAHTGHDAGGADGAGANAHLDGVGTGFEHGAGTFVGGHVTCHQLAVGVRGLDLADGLEHVQGMTVGGVQDEHVHTGPDELLGAFVAVAADADGGTHAQATGAVLAGVGVFLDFVDVLHGDEAAQTFVLVHHEELFDAVFVQVALGFFQGGAHGHGDQVLAGHHFAHADGGGVFDEAHVTVGEDAHQLAVIHNRQTGHAEIRHQVQGFLHGIAGGNGNGVKNHAAFALLDAFHFQALAFDGHVLMDDADAALAGDGDGHPVLSHGVHGGADEGDIQMDLSGQTGTQVDVRGEYIAGGGDQKHVVKGKAMCGVSSLDEITRDCVMTF